MRFTNESGISLAMSVWLVHHEYSLTRPAGSEGKPVISATSLLKPTKQYIMGTRAPMDDRVNDVTDFIGSRLGTAIHDSVEKSWKHGYKDALKLLGYSQDIIDHVRINPETVLDGEIPIYLEQRYEREIDGICISGQFDMIIEGELNDIKSTSVWTYMKGSKLEDYKIQGSLYRWINPDKVTKDYIRIQHVFTDWQKMMTKTTPGYPTKKLVEVTVPLMSLAETEEWIRAKLREINANKILPEEKMIRCSDKDLWRSDPKFKYYSDPLKAQTPGSRSTKNFDNLADANRHMMEAHKGIVITEPGQVKACSYCPAFDICKQKDEYEHE